jgi:hypothetical protein
VTAFVAPQNHRNANELIFGGEVIHDASRKAPTYSVFGDTITGVKRDEITVSFQVGISTFDAISTVTGGGAVTSIIPQAQVASGVPAAGTAEIQSVQSVKYRAGKEGYSFFTCEFTTQTGGVLGIANSNQQIGFFDDQNGFYVGFTGVDFCIASRKAAVDTIVTQENFNRDKLDGSGYSGFTADFSKNNVYKISFGYLGAASITYEISRQDGVWITFHVIEYPNSSLNTHISNPVLPVTCRVEKTAGATNVTMRTSSWSAGTIIGDTLLEISNRPFAYTNTKTILAGIRTNIFTLRVSTGFAGLSNRIPIQPVYITIAADGTKNVDIRVLKNPTVSGSPSFSDADANNSVTQIDIAGTSVLGGTLVLPIILGKTESQSLITRELRILTLPGERITFSALSSNASDVSIGCRWMDKF